MGHGRFGVSAQVCRGSVTLSYRCCNAIVPSAMGQVDSTERTGASTEQRVIDGARRAIASGGWQAATLTRIAEEAGVSRMTLHRRGLGRDEIFALLARDYENAFRSVLWPCVTARGSGAERLEATLVAVCEVTEDHLS